MIHRLICRLFGHDWRKRSGLMFDNRFEALHLCHRCGKLDWL
jgi:hypothetical protein